jgi:hypothetical protein
LTLPGDVSRGRFSIFNPSNEVLLTKEVVSICLSLIRKDLRIKPGTHLEFSVEAGGMITLPPHFSLPG